MKTRAALSRAIVVPVALVAALLTSTASGADAVPAQPGAFTGYAFDTATAPTQAQMDTLWRTSPYAGVGVYIAGANRYDEVQTNLTPTWIATQLSRGWRILPLTVGRQASCYKPGTAPEVTRIDPTPGADSTYPTATAQGVAEADATVAASQALGLPQGTTQWLDIEHFDVADDHCRRSMLRFLAGWTDRLHALGYQSGLYSNAAAGIDAVELARKVGVPYSLPDQVWFAHWNDAVTTSTSYLDPSAWVRQRIHQYAGDDWLTYGGVTLKIDRNWMDIGGGTRTPPKPSSCGVRIDFGNYGTLRKGDTGRKVKALQCLLRKEGSYDGKVAGRYDRPTKRAVLRFQRKHAVLADTGVTTRATWMLLLTRGSRPFLKVGAGVDAVRRVQRALNAAAGEGLAITGVFDRPTERAVVRYQARVGLAKTGVVVAAVWSQIRAARR